MEDVIKAFLTPGSGSGYGDGSGDGSGYGYGYGSGSGYGDGYGYGSGYGDGSGDGSGYGDGYGYGSGDGYGYGSGDGYGSGYGDGYGLKSINGFAVYRIDDTNTVIFKVRGNIAKGAVVKRDLTLKPCYIVKQGAYFAHGETLHKAVDAVNAKHFEDMPLEECIARFMETHAWGVEYSDADYFEWHHLLTGSCEMGRRQFAADHGLENLDGSRTVEDFIALTRDAYGGAAIRRLEEAYKSRKEAFP